MPKPVQIITTQLIDAENILILEIVFGKAIGHWKVLTNDPFCQVGTKACWKTRLGQEGQLAQTTLCVSKVKTPISEKTWTAPCTIKCKVTSSYLLIITITTLRAMSMLPSVLWRVLSVRRLWRQCWLLYHCCLLLLYVCPSVCYGWPKFPGYNTADKRAPNIPLTCLVRMALLVKGEGEKVSGSSQTMWRFTRQFIFVFEVRKWKWENLPVGRWLRTACWKQIFFVSFPMSFKVIGASVCSDSGQ